MGTKLTRKPNNLIWLNNEASGPEYSEEFWIDGAVLLEITPAVELVRSEVVHDV